MSEWMTHNLTKHGQILEYIEGLDIGTKISVRKIAKDLGVSEGTAYRAIKEAGNLGLVSTKERTGTVRIEKSPRNNLYNLTFSDVVKIVEGRVLGGEQGLDKTLNKFVIGAMKQDAMMRYIDAGSLLIVGNRDQAHHCALEQGAGVLITGGFDTNHEVKALADQLQLPIISSAYDTYTVASMINRAMYDRLIKKKMMLVEDMAVIKSSVSMLKNNHTVEDWKQLLEQTGHSRFPVVDEWNRVVGMITSKDIVGAEDDQSLDKLMTRNPLTAQLQTSVASAAHMMVWEGIELLPVVDAHRKLLGVISRKDVLGAMQYIQNQPQIGETFEDLIWSEFTEDRDDKHTLFFKGTITPQMTSHIGTVSEGVMAILVMKAAFRAIRNAKKGDLVLENISTYFVRPVQLESEIEIRPKIIEVSRKFGKVDVEVYCHGSLVCKSMLTAQVINQV
jgi:predicted transcriptional regulator